MVQIQSPTWELVQAAGAGKKKKKKRKEMPFFFLFFFCLFAFARAALSAYGGSQARGLIRAIAAGLRQSHSNEGSEPRLQPTPQLTATLDP